MKKTSLCVLLMVALFFSCDKSTPLPLTPGDDGDTTGMTITILDWDDPQVHDNAKR